MLNNNIFTGNKKLSTIMFYSTDRCNSKCKHCYIWAKKPKEDLSFDKIKEIINSKVVSKDTVIGLEGGEFIMHPEAEQILDFLSKHHKKYDLLSNGIMKDKLIEYTRKYKPMRLYLSLDGDRETYKKMRGADGHGKVVEIIKELKDEIPISIMFTLTPYNNFDDLKHVADICLEHKIDMRVGIFNTMEYFETNTEDQDPKTLQYTIKEIPEVVKQFEENYDFMLLYTKYREGNLKLSCNSIKDSIVIYPNGDVPICQNKEIIIGNVNKESIHQVINKKSTRQLHKKHKHGCNECWINFHRKYDIVLYRSLEKMMPKKMVELFMGKYYWSENKKKKYSCLIRENE